MNTKSKVSERSSRYQSSREVFQEYIPNFNNNGGAIDPQDWNPVSNGEDTAERLLDQFRRSIGSNKASK